MGFLGRRQLRAERQLLAGDLIYSLGYLPADTSGMTGEPAAEVASMDDFSNRADAMGNHAGVVSGNSIAETMSSYASGPFKNNILSPIPSPLPKPTSVDDARCEYEPEITDDFMQAVGKNISPSWELFGRNEYSIPRMSGGVNVDFPADTDEVLLDGTANQTLRFRGRLTLERKACRKGCLQPEL